jgi:hypothetical protein
MTQSTAQTLTSICLVVGTFMLAIEAVGRERAQKIETLIQKTALGAEQVFAGVIVWLAAPWKKLEEIPLSALPDSEKAAEKRPFLLHEKQPRWIGPAFLTISVLSLIIFNLATNRFGEQLVTIVCISSWLGMILSSVILVFSINTFQTSTKLPSTFLNKCKLLVLSATIVVTGLLFGVTALITFLSSWPAALIFVVYVGIYVLATILRRIIDFRIRYNLGNILMIFGLALSIGGIIVQHLISVGVFTK